MTIDELLEKNELQYEKKKLEAGIMIYKIENINIMFWINEGNDFRMKRKWFEKLESNCDQYAIFGCDKVNKKFYYMKFQNKNNWLSGSFRNCSKSELHLGKQVLNYQSTISKLMVDLQKYRK